MRRPQRLATLAVSLLLAILLGVAPAHQVIGCLSGGSGSEAPAASGEAGDGDRGHGAGHHHHHADAHEPPSGTAAGDEADDSSPLLTGLCVPGNCCEGGCQHCACGQCHAGLVASDAAGDGELGAGDYRHAPAYAGTLLGSDGRPPTSLLR